jgi:hypothetical protein
MESCQQPARLDGDFWERLDRLEHQHRHVRCRHREARRALEASRAGRPGDRLNAWARYCEIIDELDRATVQLEALRACAG